jgi:hypothetical protein
MFGDQPDNNANDQQAYGAPTDGGSQSDQPTLSPPVGSDPTPDSSAGGGLQLPGVPPAQDTPSSDTDAGDYMTDDDGAPATDQDQPASTDNDYTANDQSAPSDDSASDQPVTDAAVASPAPTGTTGSSELLDIKQQALQQLTPLVDHLEQSPKEEFRTTMMMIQATDNQDLIKKAFDAAQKFQDDKERAQAFLDIINEINYFTQHPQQ